MFAPIYDNEALMNLLYDANEAYNFVRDEEVPLELRAAQRIIAGRAYARFLQTVLNIAAEPRHDIHDVDDYLNYFMWNEERIADRVRQLEEMLRPEEDAEIIAALRGELARGREYMKRLKTFTIQERGVIRELVKAHNILASREKQSVKVLRALQARLISHFDLLHQRRHFEPATGLYEASGRDDQEVLQEYVNNTSAWLIEAGLVDHETSLNKAYSTILNQPQLQAGYKVSQQRSLHLTLDNIHLERQKPILERLQRQLEQVLAQLQKRLEELLHKAYTVTSAIAEGLFTLEGVKRTWNVVTNPAESWSAFLKYADGNRGYAIGFVVGTGLVIVGCGVGAMYILPFAGIASVVEFAAGAAAGILVAGAVGGAVGALARVDHAREAIRDVAAEEAAARRRHEETQTMTREEFVRQAEREGARRAAEEAAEEYDQAQREFDEAFNNRQLAILDRSQVEVEQGRIKEVMGELERQRAETAGRLASQLAELRRQRQEEADVRRGMLAARSMAQRFARDNPVAPLAEEDPLAASATAKEDDAEFDRVISTSGADLPILEHDSGAEERDSRYSTATAFLGDPGAARGGGAPRPSQVSRFVEQLKLLGPDLQSKVKAWLEAHHPDLRSGFCQLRETVDMLSYLDEELSKKQQRQLLTDLFEPSTETDGSPVPH